MPEREANGRLIPARGVTNDDDDDEALKPRPGVRGPPPLLLLLLLPPTSSSRLRAAEVEEAPDDDDDDAEGFHQGATAVVAIAGADDVGVAVDAGAVEMEVDSIAALSLLSLLLADDDESAAEALLAAKVCASNGDEEPPTGVAGSTAVDELLPWAKLVSNDSFRASPSCWARLTLGSWPAITE